MYVCAIVHKYMHSIIHNCMHTYYSLIHSFIHSFIHIKHLYSASSSKLLRSAPNTSTVKKNSIKVRKNAGERVLLKIRSSEGRTFHVDRPTMENVWISLMEVRRYKHTFTHTNMHTNIHTSTHIFV